MNPLHSTGKADFLKFLWEILIRKFVQSSASISGLATSVKQHNVLDDIYNAKRHASVYYKVIYVPQHIMSNGTISSYSCDIFKFVYTTETRLVVSSWPTAA